MTIVACSDFHGPVGTRVGPTLAQLETDYGDKVKRVLRDYPLDQLHPGAHKVYEAARCAHEQGRCWASHDALCVNAPKTSPEQLKAYAQEAGLDLLAFDQCVGSGKYQATVQQDVEEGARAGVTCTLAFVINGRGLSDAQPLERFVQRIVEERARAW